MPMPIIALRTTKKRRKNEYMRRRVWMPFLTEGPRSARITESLVSRAVTAYRIRNTRCTMKKRNWLH